MNQPNQPNLKMPQGGNGNGDQPIDEVPMFKRKRVIIPLFLALVAVVAGAWVWYMEQSKSIATDDAYIEAYRSTISSKVPAASSYLKAMKATPWQRATRSCGSTIPIYGRNFKRPKRPCVS